MGYSKILCAVDFSPTAREALRAASKLAVDNNAELTLVHVWQPPMYSFGPEAPFPGSVLQDLISDAEKSLDAWVAEAKQLGAKRVKGEFMTGVAWDQVVEALRRDNAYDLVVVGTHGRTGLKHVVLGSVAEKIVRHAPCAVLVVRSR